MAEPITLSIDGHRIAALAFNQDKPGTPLVFIHGITSSIFFWTAGQTPDVHDHPWYSLSLPGHAPAAVPPGFEPRDLTDGMIARVLSAAVQQLTGDRPAILAGHSTGGFAALAMAACAPPLVRSLVIVSGFAQGTWIGQMGFGQRLARRGLLGRTLFKANFRWSLRSRTAFRGSVYKCAADRQAIGAHPELNHLLDQTYPSARQLDRDAMLCYFGRMPDIDISDQLPAITAPTLVIAGDRDPIVPLTQAHLIADHVPGAQLAVFPGAGHLPMWERPNDYHRSISEWIRKTA
ncbi:MAG: alpha/beta hydrolase [Anaerolineae bacterium]|nr:alpha/beta hydrolase [Anaerolineae bacterium]